LHHDGRKPGPVFVQCERPALAYQGKPSFRIFEGKEMKRKPARRNPMAKALAKPQYRPRIKPDKRRKIEAKRIKQHWKR
jgi:hypothetical protein